MLSGWFALRCKPRKEEVVCAQLSLRNIEVFYPRIRVQVINPRAASVRAYFPGYVFIHANLSDIGFNALQWLPGASGVVSFGGEPASVPDGLIEAVRRKVDRINGSGGEFYDGLKLGETVEISSGPFAGYEAIFDARLPGTERVRVMLKLLQKRQFLVELPAAQVQRQKKSPNI